MILPWLFRALPGPVWLRLAVLLAAAVSCGFALWEWGFPWLVQHFGTALDGSPTVGQGGSGRA
ncbi:hypothetical protein [Streptacidiphilus sp. MAP5-3]|uniref:hypothetical protein n=1 Tax=unclassified Streptacidiphilus TaxID=2643834 RepID=UPI0035186B9C